MAELQWALIGIQALLLLVVLVICSPSVKEVKQGLRSISFKIFKTSKLNPEVEEIILKTRLQQGRYGLSGAVLALGGQSIWDLSEKNGSGSDRLLGHLLVRFLWQFLALLFLFLLSWMKPKSSGCLQKVLNLSYALFMLSLPCFLLKELCPTQFVPSVVTTMLLLRCCLLPLCDSVTLVFLSNAACHVAVALAMGDIFAFDRPGREGNGALFYNLLVEGNSGINIQRILNRYPDAVRVMDAWVSMCLCVVCFWMQRTLTMNVSQFVEVAGLKSEGQAVSSLLATICDAHFYLDQNLCLEADSPGLASMLFLQNRNQGAAFARYIASEEEQHRFQTAIEADVEQTLAQVMHMHLRDGVGNVIPVEMFHVKVGKVGKASSYTRHLLGVREFSDKELPPNSEPLERVNEKPSNHSPSVSSVSSVSSEGEESNGHQRPYILFDARTLEVINASKQLLNKMGLILGEQLDLQDFVSPNCREDLFQQLASCMVLILQDHESSHSRTVTFALNHRKVKKQRFKEWQLLLQNQGGQVIGRLQPQEELKASWRHMNSKSSELASVPEPFQKMQL